MMSYRYDKEQKKKQQRYLAAGIVVLLAFFTPVFSILFNWFERPLLRAWEQSQANIEEVGNIFERWYAKGKIIEENEELRRRISLLEVDVMRTDYLVSVLESYQERESYASSGELIIPAEIVLRYPQVSRDTVVLNRGSSHSVQEGDYVLGYNQLLLGIVTEVTDLTSFVTLFTDTDTSIEGVLYPHGETIRLDGVGTSYRSQVPRDSLVEVGDVVYSQQEPGRILAVVREVVFDSRDPMKSVYLSLPINTKNIPVVGVLKKATG
jgi:cell shape-determining protein MreC